MKRTPIAVYYNENPYETSKTALSAVIFNPDDYRLNQILVVLSPVALRVLFYAMAKADSGGQIELSPTALTRRLQTGPSYVSRGIRDLVKYNFMKRNTRTTFWLNPAVCRPITQTIG